MQPSTDYARPVHGQPLALYPDAIPDWRPKADSPTPSFVPSLTPRFPAGHAAGQKRGLVMVAPGGGYFIRAAHEGLPFCDLFNEAGVASALLDYRTAGECEIPLRRGPYMDARRAVRLVRAHAGAWGVDPDKIALLGFSAGGHLAATLAAYPEPGCPDGFDEAERAPSHINAALYGYPYLGPIRPANWGPLVGNDAQATREDLVFFDLAAKISDKMPPSFFYMTGEDGLALDALRMATAMHEAKVPVCVHMYPHGQHGLGLARDNAELKDWSRLAVEWIKNLGY